MLLIYKCRRSNARAVRLLHEHKPEGWIEKLSLIVRQVTAEDVLRQCARAFLANGADRCGNHAIDARHNGEHGRVFAEEGAPDTRVDAHTGDDERAKEVYVKLDDVESLLGLYVRKQDWDAALKLAEDPNGTFSEETRAKFDEALYLPYAEWLAVHDKSACGVFLRSYAIDATRLTYITLSRTGSTRPSRPTGNLGGRTGRRA